MKVLQAQREQSKAESDSAIDRLRANMETLRADMERHRATINEKMEENAESMRATSNANTMKIMIAMGIGIAFLSGVVGFLGFLLNGNI